jgi:hypothetical protein
LSRANSCSRLQRGLPGRPLPLESLPALLEGPVESLGLLLVEVLLLLPLQGLLVLVLLPLPLPLSPQLLLLLLQLTRPEVLLRLPLRLARTDLGV